MTEFPHPMRLAKGSHEPGSGKGCAMNVVSYINGDVEITDYPACSARPLARIMQIVNDRLAGPDGFLSPEDSVRVLDLGWRTVGTAGADESVPWRWLRDLLVDPEWGVIRHVNQRGRVVIGDVADLLARKSAGEYVDPAAARAARAAAYAPSAAAYAVHAAAYAAHAAAYAAGYAAGAAAYAAHAAAYAAHDAARADVVDLADWAVTRWRELQGIDAKPADIETAALNDAISRIGTPA